MSQPVNTSDRYNSPSRRCPICNGWERGNPQCKGYRGEKEGVIFCTNSDYAGALPRGDTGVFRHWTGQSGCKCGVSHLSTSTFSTPTTPPKQTRAEQMNNHHAPSPGDHAAKQVEETYDYGDGCFVDRVLTGGVKKDGKPEKTFQQYQIIDGKKIYSGFKKLYRIKEAKTKGGVLIIAEGERKVNKLWEMGFTSTCNVGGSGQWMDSYADEMTGFSQVLIWPDNDDETNNFASQKWAGKIGESLKSRRVSWNILNSLTVGLPPKGDVMDWVKIPGNDAAKLQAELDKYRPKKQFFTPDEFGSIPRTRWLLEPIFIEQGLSLTVGESEVGKSFITLHYGLRIATELELQVVYLGLESFSQYPERVLAWLDYYRVDDDSRKNFILSSYPLQLMDKENVEGFIAELKRHNIKPAMVIIDTYHAATTGADEISGKDTGEIVENLKLLRDELKANINCLHHLNASGMRERGHTSLKAAMDTMLTLRAEGDGVVVECTKQRTAAHFQDRSINWAYIDNPVDRTQPPSRVAVESDQAVRVDYSRPSKNDAKILRILGNELNKVGGLRFSELQDASNLAKSSMNNCLKKLARAGWVQGGGTSNYKITNDGLAVIGYDAAPIDDF